MNTRKYPRTMQQAFGPYTSNQISEPRRAMSGADRFFWACSIAAAILLIAVVVVA